VCHSRSGTSTSFTRPSGTSTSCRVSCPSMIAACFCPALAVQKQQQPLSVAVAVVEVIVVVVVAVIVAFVGSSSSGCSSGCSIRSFAGQSIVQEPLDAPLMPTLGQFGLFKVEWVPYMGHPRSGIHFSEDRCASLSCSSHCYSRSIGSL